MNSNTLAAMDPNLGVALGLANEGWEEVRRSPYTQQQLGATLTRLPHISFVPVARATNLRRGGVVVRSGPRGPLSRR